MKKMVLLALMVALAALMLAAAPAFADNDDDNGDDNNINDRDRFRLNNVGNVDVSPSFDVSQETEQDSDTGEVSQPTSVTGGGDNSIQTVGLQPNAVTGSAQNAVGVLDFDPIVAGLGGDTVFNTDDNNVINGDDDNGDDGVDISDRDVFRLGGDRLNINGGSDEFDLEDINSSIDASPSLVVNGGGTIEQAAAA